MCALEQPKWTTISLSKLLTKTSDHAGVEKNDIVSVWFDNAAYPLYK